VDEIGQDFKISKWPLGERYKIHIAILTVITLVVGVYFISTTVLIAKDGVLYIEIARKIADNANIVIHDTRQAPGYPFLIYLTHKALGLFYKAQSLQGWIISAQVVSLLSKLIATIALYFVGSCFVGSRVSFWGVLILSLLPDSLDFGSDALTDWPSLMFLAIGFLLLLWGVQHRKCRIFGCAGITAGLGYLIRPECGQVVLYGCIWLLFNLIRPEGKMKRTKTAGALILLIACFATVAIPYMRSIGYVFPEQRIWKLPLILNVNDVNVDSVIGSNLCLAGLSVGKLIGNETLITNMCETLMYYFTPALLLGIYYYFRKQSITLEQAFFTTSFIIVNVAITLWQSSYLGFLSRRHTFPLVAFTIYFIPVGFQVIAGGLGRKKIWNKPGEREDAQSWFFVLMVIGICICGVKLVRMAPLRWEKQGYRDTAEWLCNNTTPADFIAVPDRRIYFYAEREGMEYQEKIPKRATYAVSIEKNRENKPDFGKETQEVYSTRVNHRQQDAKLVVYRVIPKKP
jgi:4-amino-4-deoxy-L-arabinose transferase-like glycosyltransferase